jgi:mannose-6-phosphate isomerase-like protein (cupin superfamily)
MPKVSRDNAQVEDHGAVEDRHGELEGYTVNMVTFRQDIDATPLMKGLPDDRCQCPHWGFVVKGKMTMRFGDREEAYESGDAYYAPPGHVPVKHEPGTEIAAPPRS